MTTPVQLVDPDYVNNQIAAAVAAVPRYLPATFTATGALSTFTGAARFVCPVACQLASVSVSVGTAPTGTSLIIDVDKNGTTIFGTQANRPTVPISQNEVITPSTAATVTSFAAGDAITVDLDQIGSSVAGSDLQVTVLLVPQA